jgi:hypothetical protein
VTRPCVYLASPLSGDEETNQAYARLAMADSLRRGESPYVPHLLLTQVLDDTKPEDRAAGMESGESWLAKADHVVTCVDLGISNGMMSEVKAAQQRGVPVRSRKLFASHEGGDCGACDGSGIDPGDDEAEAEANCEERYKGRTGASSTARQTRARGTRGR